MSIKPHEYNEAKDLLEAAGSRTAAKAHRLHSKNGDVSDHFGKELLRYARDDFRNMDVGHENLKSEMTHAHYHAIHAAAEKMGIESW